MKENFLGRSGHVEGYFEHNIEEFVALGTTVPLLKDFQLLAVVNCEKLAAFSVLQHVSQNLATGKFSKIY
jgi:hypothetical protein